MAELRIRVSAFSDRSLSVAHRPLIESAQKATSLVNREAQRTGDGVAKGVKKGTDAAEKAYAKLEKEAAKYQKQMVREAEKAARDEAKAVERAKNEEVKAHEKAEREKTRATAREAAARNREIQRQIKDAERSRRAVHTQSGTVGGAFGSVASGVGGVGRAGARAAMGIAGTIARGAGVDLDLGSGIKAGVDLEKRAVDLANSGYMPGKAGPAGVRQDPGKIANEVRQAAQGTASTSGEAIEGLQAFVGKTGDLQTGRDLLFDMAKLAKATGSSLEDMLDAAGDVSNGLGDVDNKAEKVKGVMASFAQQGKVGAVEIKNLASQMAGLQAAAAKFEGDGAKNLALMGGLAQMARATGGAKSAPQAVTAVQSLAAQLSKEKRLKGMAGLDVQAKTDAGFNRPLNEIIIDVLKGSEKAARKGGHGMRDFDKISMSAFQDQQARRAFDPLANIYKQAGGGEAGVQAVSKALDEMTNATMSATEINESFAAAMNTSDAKAKIFNEQLAELATKLKTNLQPALEALAPVILDAVKGLGEFAGILTGKPKNDADRRAQIVGNSAQDQSITLGRAGAGEISPEEKAKAQATLDALNKQIALRAENATSAPGSGMKAAGWAVDHSPFGALLNAITGGSIGNEVVEAKQRNSEQDERGLKLLLDQQQELATFIKGAHTRPREVFLVGSTVKLIPDAPPPAGGNGGTQPPPGPQRPPGK